MNATPEQPSKGAVSESADAAASASAAQRLGRAEAIMSTSDDARVWDGDQQDRADRAALRRVRGLSTELEDVTEVEYRQLRLEQVVLASVATSSAMLEAEMGLRELAALAETAGSQVLDAVIQRRDKPDTATYLGSGKAQELKEIVASVGADTVICDEELTPSQRRGLEDIVKVKVIDRTALILDIFAQHAKSREGKAQVELAQYEYLLPRLRGWGESLSRQGGGQAAGGVGIGGRGPGETKIELDRRRIRTKMAKLRRAIAAMKTHRETQREHRRRNEVPAVVIVGYTNAGKSSLLNRITDAGVLVENALFATLDPTVRRAMTPDKQPFTIADTVGFVRSLPHQLVEAFRSTLEEVADADLILHVVDGSHPDPFGQISAVRHVLADVEAHDLPEVIVVNKIDQADEEVLAEIARRERDHIFVSAHSGAGLDELRQLISERIPRPQREMHVLVPYTEGALVHQVHEKCDVITESHEANGTYLHARVTAVLAAHLEEFEIPASDAPTSQPAGTDALPATATMDA